ncbi:hypothetical protein HPB52_017175 [Rhipicephalus sanguineus]|uniref:Uncharacterized protein n=1 Tax=Rhipicephalus sanguineus TaxID=34632 RepID=A0A9D4T678_RHISA|nr:hypothetical protein HPB52_017175 [Rhipicephalus sanguineus]
MGSGHASDDGITPREPVVNTFTAPMQRFPQGAPVWSRQYNLAGQRWLPGTVTSSVGAWLWWTPPEECSVVTWTNCGHGTPNCGKAGALRDKPIPQMAAARIQRWALLLSAYQYDSMTAVCLCRSQRTTVKMIP